MTPPAVWVKSLQTRAVRYVNFSRHIAPPEIILHFITVPGRLCGSLLIATTVPYKRPCTDCVQIVMNKAMAMASFNPNCLPSRHSSALSLFFHAFYYHFPRHCVDHTGKCSVVVIDYHGYKSVAAIAAITAVAAIVDVVAIAAVAVAKASHAV